MASKNKYGGLGIAVLPLTGILALAHWPNAIAILAIAGSTIIALWAARYLKYTRAARRVERKLVDVVNNNLLALARRRAQLLRTDPYGNLKSEKWLKEIDYFISMNLLSALDDYDQSVAVKRSHLLIDYVESTVAARTELETHAQDFRENMTPIEYENYCAEELKRSGWEARVTMASRDQGVDVIAQKEGIRLAIQCKLFRSPVGNKAVQEVVAARAHERADFAIVVSNNSFTSAAEELARTNNVLLLHHRDLTTVDKLLCLPQSICAAGPSKLESGSENSSTDTASEMASFSDVIRFPQSWRLPFYAAVTMGLVAIVANILTRTPSNLERGAIRNQMPTMQKTEAVRASTAISSSETRATSSNPIRATASAAPANLPSSPYAATVEKAARSAPEPRSATLAESSGDLRASVERLERGGRIPETRAPENPVAGHAKAFRCLPASPGDTTSIEISVTDGNWSVLHRPKKGAAIQRAGQYYISDTSGERELSWQGVHRQNRELKMIASLSPQSANGSRVYKEEVFDANIGKVVETTAVCKELRASPAHARSR